MAGPEGEIKAKGLGRAQQGQAGRTGNGKQVHSCCARRWAGGPARRELCRRASGRQRLQLLMTAGRTSAGPTPAGGKARGEGPHRGRGWPLFRAQDGAGQAGWRKQNKVTAKDGLAPPPPARFKGIHKAAGRGPRPPVGGTPGGSRRQMDTRSGCSTSGVQSPRCAGGNQPPSTNPAPGCPPERSRASTRGSERPTSGCNGALDRRW